MTVNPLNSDRKNDLGLGLTTAGSTMNRLLVGSSVLNIGLSVQIIFMPGGALTSENLYSPKEKTMAGNEVTALPVSKSVAP
ncbi:hypothetical protein D3C84_1075630 [compost metagenome]